MTGLNRIIMIFRRRFKLQNLGFHGDRHLIDIIEYVSVKATQFIETGTNVGSTLKFYAGANNTVNCFSCEPDKKAYKKARNNVSGLENVTLYNLLSQDFMDTLKKDHSEIFEKRTIFWLDAHDYGFEWPLKQEIAFAFEHFNQAYIFIDDFKVPHLDMFGYDKYLDQECSFEYIKDAIPDRVDYQLFYPNYTERTSKHHPLRGWGLIAKGEPLVLPDRFSSTVIEVK